MADKTTDFAAHFAHAADHYVPDVHISDDGDEPFTADHIARCAERLGELAAEITVDLAVPQHFEYLNADGEQMWGDLNEADAETLAAGLAYTAAQGAALQRELARVAEQGIALLRRLDTTGTAEN